VLSPDGRRVAAGVRHNGAWGIAVDDVAWPESYDMVWDPVFSPDGSKLLLRTIEGGTYFRRVMPVADITG